MNLINLLGIFGGISEFFYLALGLAFVIGLVWVFLKFKDSREIIIKILVILLMIALFISALVCGYKTYNYFTANSTNWGDFIGTVLNKTEVNYLGDYTFKIDNVQFDYTGTEDTYKITYQTKELVDIDLDSANLVIYVNDMPTYNVEKGSDYINGDYSYTFYNEDRQEILTDKLAIKFAFYANYAKFTVTTTGGETAVNLWQDYINKNNFTISLKTASYQQGDEIIANGIRNYFNITINFSDNKLFEYLDADTQIELKLINSNDEEVSVLWLDNLRESKTVLLDYGMYTCEFESNNENLFFNCNESAIEIIKGQYDIQFNCEIYNYDVMILTFYENDTYTQTYHKVSKKIESSELVKGNESLYKAEIPPIVEEIGDQVFHHCSELVEIKLSNNLIKIGDLSIYLCNKLKFPGLPDSLTYIGSGSFGSCSAFEGVVLTDNIQYLGSYAFSNCDNIVFTEKDNLKYIGSAKNPYIYLIGPVDSYASKYEYIVENGCKFIGASVSLINRLESLILPEGLVGICEHAFNSTDLKEINIPDSVMYIDGNPFSFCRYLTAINVADDNKYFSSIDGVLYNKDLTTLICYPASKEDVDTISLNGVVSVGQYAFSRNTTLISIILDESIEEIGSGAFQYCSNLKEITILNNGVNLSNNNIFDECVSLTAINFSGTKQEWSSLGEFRYYNCQTITIHCSDGDIVVN